MKKKPIKSGDQVQLRYDYSFYEFKRHNDGSIVNIRCDCIDNSINLPKGSILTIDEIHQVPAIGCIPGSTEKVYVFTHNSVQYTIWPDMDNLSYKRL